MAKKKQNNFDAEDYFIGALMEIGLTEDEAERELEDMGMDMQCMMVERGMAIAHIDCTGFAQVGRDDYDEKQRFEKKYLRYRLFELIGNPPLESYLKWTANPHDFGTYHDMVYHYRENNPAHIKYLDKLDGIDMEAMERSIQSNWDAQQMGQPMKFLEFPHEDNEIFNLIE